MNEPKSTGELKDSANKILDATYKKADLSSNAENSCKQLTLHKKQSYWTYYWNFRSCLMEH